MNSERCSQCKHFIIANAGEGKIYGCDRSKCVFEPTTKNDLAVDCISRADAIRVASGYCHPSNVAKELAKLPSVSPQEPRKGHWIPTYGNVKCSVCGSVKDSREVGKATHYCDFCGAKMESEEV